MTLLPHRTYDLTHTIGNATRRVTLTFVGYEGRMAVFESEFFGTEFIPVSAIVRAVEVREVVA